MSDASTTRLWSTITVHDADAMAAFLGAIGFTEHATYRDRQDPSRIVHAEWVRPGGGGVMFGTSRPDDLLDTRPTGLYLVVDDPDAVVDAAIAVGATVVLPVVDQDYGGRGGTVRDPDGNQWSFGDYQPA